MRGRGSSEELDEDSLRARVLIGQRHERSPVAEQSDRIAKTGARREGLEPGPRPHVAEREVHGRVRLLARERDERNAGAPDRDHRELPVPEVARDEERASRTAQSRERVDVTARNEAPERPVVDSIRDHQVREGPCHHPITFACDPLRLTLSALGRDALDHVLHCDAAAHAQFERQAAASGAQGHRGAIRQNRK